jgi:hypothetical protein
MTAHADPADTRITRIGEWGRVAGLDTVEHIVQKPSLRMTPPFGRELLPIVPPRGARGASGFGPIVRAPVGQAEARQGR